MEKIEESQGDNCKEKGEKTNNKMDLLLQDFLYCGGDKSVVRLLWFLFKHNKTLLLCFLLATIRSFGIVLMPKAYSTLTDSVASGNILIIKRMFFFTLSIKLVNYFLDILNEILDNKVIYSMDSTINSLMYSYISKQDAAYKARISSAKFSINTNNLLKFPIIWQRINSIFGLLLELMFVLIALFFSGSLVTNSLIFSFIIFYCFFFFFTKKVYNKATSKNAQGLNTLSQTIINCFNSLNSVNIFNRQKNMAEIFEKSRDYSIKARTIMFYIRLGLIRTLEFLFIILDYSILIFIIIFIYNGKLSIGALTFFGILMFRFYSTLQKILGTFTVLEDIAIAKEAMKNVFYRDMTASTEYINHCSKDLLPFVPSKSVDINLKNLSVRIQNLNERRNRVEETIISIDQLDIKHGHKYIVVGPSGCGKSSLANVLVGLWCYEGQFLLAGQDVKTMSLDNLRKNVTLISQETTLLPITMAENIAYANPEATEEEIENAAKMACIHDVIMSLPNQYQTIPQDSCFLSFGEIQRVALSRLFLSKAKIIILDESTSALDIPTELNIYANIAKFCADRTLIVIAHRMAVLKYFDNVIFMNEGRVIASDSHKKLLKNHPQYREFAQNIE